MGFKDISQIAGSAMAAQSVRLNTIASNLANADVAAGSEAEAYRARKPVFAAALIRQESNFTPSAVSRAGARGLMQVMPSVGHGLARGMGYPIWDPVLLYEPDVNLELGMAHLGELSHRYDTPVRILAAYNAGVSRVERWNDKAGAADPEIFAERIPYAETRDYVRIIPRNEDFYRALYDWGAES